MINSLGNPATEARDLFRLYLKGDSFESLRATISPGEQSDRVVREHRLMVAYHCERLVEGERKVGAV